MEKNLNEKKIRNFCRNIFKKSGLSSEDAFIAADSLVFANLRGIDSHGIIRLPFYVQRLIEGGTKVKPKIKKIKGRAALTLLDGDNGMGQIIGMYATKLAIEKANKVGISFVGVRNSSHYGAASYYSIKVAESNMIGISMSNSTPVMAAWGGSKRIIGNNPLSIACPYQEGKPIVLDISMSKVAGGKVRLAAKNIQKIPKDWIIDQKGRKTENPNDFPGGGALLPFGEHKGYGLAVIIEILTGVLTDAGMLRQIPLWIKNMVDPLNVGHCFIAIDIEAFMDLTNFKERLDWLVQELKSSPLAEGSKGVFMPGEMELEIERERRKDGIPISEEIWQDLKKLSKKYQESL